MPTAAELHRGILADPDNLDLRMKYASAVEDTDPEHAELIGLQVTDLQARRSGSSAPADSQPGSRTDRSDRPPIGRSASSGVSRYELARRFRGPGAHDRHRIPNARRVAAPRHPVQYVELTDAAAQVGALAEFPLLARLTSLDLYGNQIGDAGLATLVESPHLGRLRWLGLAQTGVGAPGAEALAAATTLPNLQYVHFAGNPVKLTPEAAAQDWDGAPLEITMPPLGRQSSTKRHGPLALLDPARSPDSGCLTWTRSRALGSSRAPARRRERRDVPTVRDRRWEQAPSTRTP